MILIGSVHKPAMRKVLLTVGAEALHRGDFSATVLHYRYENGSFVTAEGTIDAGFGNAANYAVFGAGPKAFSAMTEGGACYLYDLVGESAYALPARVNALTYYEKKDNAAAYYALTADKLYRLQNDEATEVATVGGTALCVHHERLFAASGSKIFYSVPLSPDDFTGEGAGFLQFAGEGDVVGIASMGERLYVFRGSEIWRVTPNAKDVDFSAERMRFSGGEILAGSVMSLGGAVAFCTPRGLWVIEDSEIALALSFDGELSPAESLTCAAHEGKYFLPVLHGGSAEILVYDRPLRDAHFLRISAESVGGCTAGVYLRRGDRNMKLTAQGMPQYEGRGSELSFSLDLSNRPASMRITGGVLCGEGTFSLRIQSESGSVEKVGISDGKFSLPHVIGGTHVRVSLLTNALSRFTSLTLCMQEDKT